jgi:hypothetical protein
LASTAFCSACGHSGLCWYVFIFLANFLAILPLLLRLLALFYYCYRYVFIAFISFINFSIMLLLPIFCRN